MVELWRTAQNALFEAQTVVFVRGYRLYVRRRGML